MGDVEVVLLMDVSERLWGRAALFGSDGVKPMQIRLRFGLHDGGKQQFGLSEKVLLPQGVSGSMGSFAFCQIEGVGSALNVRSPGKDLLVPLTGPTDCEEFSV